MSHFLKSSPPSLKVALIFGSFENMLTGRRSVVQHFPMVEVRAEVASYVQMLRDLLSSHPMVSVYVLAPLYRSKPTWYASVYGEASVLFCSEVSHVDPTRVKVVPPVEVSERHLDPLGIHFGNAAHDLVIAQLLSSFGEGVFFDPQQYPLADCIGYFYNPFKFDIIVFFFFFFLNF